MKKNNTIKGLIIALTVLIMMPMAYGVKKKILYLGHDTDPSKDQKLTDRLAINYTVTYVATSATTIADIASPTNINYCKNFDVIFVSESVNGSSRPNGTLALGVPVVNAKFLVAATTKWGLLSSTGSKVDIASLSDAVVTMNPDYATHQLAAGLTGDQKLLQDDTPAYTIYLNALVNPVSGVLPIAYLKSDATKIVVAGIEPGTSMNITAATTPANATTNTKRVANIGFHVNTLNNLTESSYKLVEAAIEWVTAPISGVRVVDANELSYTKEGKNMFKFNLGSTKATKVAVYSLVGKLVYSSSTCGDNAIVDLSTQTAGVYFVKLQGDNLVGTQKIIIE